ncbi:MAG: methionine ABC transporter ATP-binding protein [Zetaproteobacteria bacterium CG1_02_49_23]|nr:MAG: methionine ABC transporter ATP-binding protein [Zetaproteobacteria bacterium CG1_02_49_23]
MIAMASPVIDIEQLRFRYSGSASDCLHIERMQVAAGERIFLHGPSGSGKSTLLGLLGGVLTPSCGTISLLGHELTQMRATARDRLRADCVGFIFQQFNLIPYLSLLDNVLLPCRFSALRRGQACISGHHLEAEAGRLLDHLDIAPELHKRAASRLSVGQQQRVAAARALIGRPGIVIADEPTSALDADRQFAFLELLQKECSASETTLLFVSHDHRLAADFDRTIELATLNLAPTNGGAS